MHSMMLENIGLGVATEKFQDELERVVRNILDPNTDAKTKRRITLSFDFEPDKDDRSRCDFSVTAECKLAKSKAYTNIVQVGEDAAGNVDCMELVAQQQDLFPQQESKPKDGGQVIAMNG